MLPKIYTHTPYDILSLSLAMNISAQPRRGKRGKRVQKFDFIFLETLFHPDNTNTCAARKSFSTKIFFVSLPKTTTSAIVSTTHETTIKNDFSTQPIFFHQHTNTCYNSTCASNWFFLCSPRLFTLDSQSHRWALKNVFGSRLCGSITYRYAITLFLKLMFMLFDEFLVLSPFLLLTVWTLFSCASAGVCVGWDFHTTTSIIDTH